MTIRDALKELKIAERLNPGPWVDHSLNTGTAARLITAGTGTFDPDRAYVYGILHDIGRRNGLSHIKHTWDGYNYLIEADEKAACISLSHSFPNKNIYEYQGEMDLTKFELMRMETILSEYDYDYYDRLIQLCDSLASADGFVKMEVRWVDVAIRNGLNEFVIQKWQRIKAIKSSLNETYHMDIDLLLGI
ncbi:MAG TPA: HDOD domain-containing protein [Thermotogota bacterium]|nr:HDOD domain-containing protein [Thermotogota bacterium]HPJ89827.1 HDOD domain-containing protein [Thermotogota bacterium]HPR96916.1 HDOD domain-containing protein [Thermotogota bacterium]